MTASSSDVHYLRIRTVVTEFSAPKPTATSTDGCPVGGGEGRGVRVLNFQPHMMGVSNLSVTMTHSGSIRYRDKTVSLQHTLQRDMAREKSLRHTLQLSNCRRTDTRNADARDGKCEQR